MSTGISRMSVSLLRSRLGQRTEMSKSFSPSTMLESALPPRALVTTLLTSAVCTPHRWHFSGSTRNSKCDWPRMWKMPTFSMPGICCSWFLVFSASVSSLSRSGPMILTELSPLMPERASITLSRIFCEKFQEMPGSLASSSAFMASTISSFVRARFGPKTHFSQPVRSATSGHSFSGRSGTKYSLL